MLNLTALIVIVFIVGYLFIALESVTKVNKAAVALLMFVAVWTLYMLTPGMYLPDIPHDRIASAAFIVTFLRLTRRFRPFLLKTASRLRI